MSLKPAAIARADYGIAQTPRLGGELVVFATTAPAGIIKTTKNLGGGAYQTKIYSQGYDGVDIVTVGATGLHGEIAGLITVPDWVLNKAKVFPVGAAGEGEIPATFGTRGDELIQVQIPDYDPSLTGDEQVWYEIGCTTSKKIKLPTRMSKAIGCQLERGARITPGASEIGELTISAKNPGHLEGLSKIGGLKSCIMIQVMRERVLEVARIFLLDWTPTIETDDGESDEEGTVQASGMFSKIAVLTAEGTALTP